MKIGVYVGSFNPVHKGHINVANYLLDNNYVDKVIMIPTPNYWDKKNLINIEDRINMLKFYENDRIIIDTKHNEYQYTCDILESLKKEYDGQLYLIIGSDNLEKFHLWKNVDKIMQNMIIVLKRNEDDKLEKFNKNFILIDKWEPLKASSTEVRNGNTLLLDKPVYEYIKKRKLYDL